MPRGLDSYPDVVVKASVYRDSLDSLSLDGALDALPADLRGRAALERVSARDLALRGGARRGCRGAGDLAPPPTWFDETVRRGMCGAFRAASVAAGARDVSAEVVDVAERETRVRVRWR